MPRAVPRFIRQHWAERAAYGAQLLEVRSADLGAEYGSGFSVSALRYISLLFERLLKSRKLSESHSVTHTA